MKGKCFDYIGFKMNNVKNRNVVVFVFWLLRIYLGRVICLSEFLIVIKLMFLDWGLVKVLCFEGLMIFLGGVLLLYRVFEEWFSLLGVRDLVL